jgi:hypothetical protein
MKTPALFLLLLAGCGGAFTSAEELPHSDAECFPDLTHCLGEAGCGQGRVCIPGDALRMLQDASADPMGADVQPGLTDAPALDAGTPDSHVEVDSGKSDVAHLPDVGPGVDSHTPSCADMPADWCGELDGGPFCDCLSGGECFGHSCITGEG